MEFKYDPRTQIAVPSVFWPVSELQRVVDLNSTTPMRVVGWGCNSRFDNFINVALVPVQAHKKGGFAYCQQMLSLTPLRYAQEYLKPTPSIESSSISLPYIVKTIPDRVQVYEDKVLYEIRYCFSAGRRSTCIQKTGAFGQDLYHSRWTSIEDFVLWMTGLEFEDETTFQYLTRKR